MNLIPTAKLRWVERGTTIGNDPNVPRILQQWWAEDLPGYMRAEAKGEWRDVESVRE